MKSMKRYMYLSLAAGMLIYAVPRLEMGQGFTLPTIFSIAWLCFALLVIAAQLHEALGVDEQQRRERARLHRFRMLALEQRFTHLRKAAAKRSGVNS